MNLADYETKLRKLESELHERLGRVGDHIKHSEGPDSPDFEDQATERQNDDVVFALNDNFTVELRAVSDALKRIENKTFGLCVKCGEEIEPARLDVVPYTTTCVNCKADD